MVTGVGATMPTGGVTVGATPPAQHVPQEAGQPPAQTTPTATTTTRRSGENRRVSVKIEDSLLHFNCVLYFPHSKYWPGAMILFYDRKKNSD